MVQLLDAVGAEGVAAMNKDTGDALANVVLEAAKLADVEAARLVVQVHDIHFFTTIKYYKYLVNFYSCPIKLPQSLPLSMRPSLESTIKQ